MTSQPGDFIGQGQTYDFTPANSTITAKSLWIGGIPSTVEVDVSASGQSWTLDFAAPTPDSLVPGTYTGATRYPFQAAGVPGLDVSGDGRGANTLTGQFTVTQAVFDASGNIVSFAASFVQYSDGSSASLSGQVDFNFTNNLPNGVLANDTDPHPGTTLTAQPGQRAESWLAHAQVRWVVQLHPDRRLHGDRQLHLYGQQRPGQLERRHGHTDPRLPSDRPERHVLRRRELGDPGRRGLDLRGDE